MMGDEDDEDIIPGDNDKEEAPQTAVTPVNPDAPSNLTHIPAIGGDIPVVLETPKT